MWCVFLSLFMFLLNFALHDGGGFNTYCAKCLVPNALKYIFITPGAVIGMHLRSISLSLYHTIIEGEDNWELSEPDPVV